MGFRSRFGLLLVLGLLVSVAQAQIQGPGRSGKLTPQRLASLIRSLHQNDPAEQVMAVVELEKAADKATAEDLALLRKVLVPELKRGIRRELGMLGRPQVAMRMQALHDRIVNEGKEPQKPTDLTANSQILAEAIAQLAATDEPARRRAMTRIRSLKALGAPALPAVKHLAETAKDELTVKAAKLTAKWTTHELWFSPSVADIKAAPPQKLDPAVIEEFLKTLVKQLTEKLDDPSPTVRTRSMRQLAGMKASAAVALKKLNKIALDRSASNIERKTAGLTIRAITTAQVEGAEWHKWKAKQDAAEARSKP